MTLLDLTVLGNVLTPEPVWKPVGLRAILRKLLFLLALLKSCLSFPHRCDVH
jgi:hypothetical protein